MKRYFALVCLALLASIAIGRAQSLDEQYVQIFNLIQEADNLSASDPAKALSKYAQAQAALQRIQRGSPDWNAKIVSFRLTYLANKIGQISSGSPATAPATTNSANSAGTTPGSAIPGTNATVTGQPQSTAPPAAELEAQIVGLKQQVRELQADRIVMEAKLKEALSMQPAEADAGELTRAQDKLKAMQKENDLLKASLETEKSKPLQSMDPKAIEQSQKTITELNTQLTAQKQLVEKLKIERDALLLRAGTSAQSSPDLATLKAENDLLKQKLTAAPAAAKPDEQARLSQAQTQIASLQSDREMLRVEKAALENRLRQLTTNTVASSVLSQNPGDAVRIRELERERDQLAKKLEAANKSLYGKKGSATASKVDQLEIELATARARLEVFEARQVPYSSEELALMKQPEAKLAEAAPKSTKRPLKDLPAGSSTLVKEAQKAYAAHEFDKAEGAYAQVVRMDSHNVPALANLAAIQIEAGHLEDAERNVRTALTEDPEDAFSLYVLGILKFRQKKFDDSLDALSRAAKLDPDNAEIQNYLGLVLSEKGMRGPAETALRKAIQLQPNYGGAHYNLAIIYLAQQPPAVEMARFHYQKALSSGHPKSAELEQRLGQ